MLDAERIHAELAGLIGPEAVLPGSTARFLHDATEVRSLRGRADAVVLPADTGQAAAVMRWCYERGVTLVPRGGGTGFAGGAVPLDGGVVLCTERMTRVRAFDPLLWRIAVEAGVTTAHLRRLVRQSGLWFPPDPGAADSSQIGGNIATNAGGPHAFKYGATGSWVTGLEAVVPPGDVIRIGGAARKDVAGYDLKHLLIGSEGTLAVITAAWLRLIPAPEAALPLVGFYRGVEQGCAAIERIMGSGVVAAALEYLDAGTLSAAGSGFPGGAPDGAGFAVLTEADGGRAEATAARETLLEALHEDALGVHAPTRAEQIAGLWRWREGVSAAVTAVRGGKVSEDIAVPLDRLAQAIRETVRIGRRHGLDALSFGHAGDANLHCTFLVTPGEPDELRRAELAADELFALAAELGGSVSGEHGLGAVKSGQLRRQWQPRAVELHTAVKALFDPRGLLNPGKKSP